MDTKIWICLKVSIVLIFKPFMRPAVRVGQKVSEHEKDGEWKEAYPVDKNPGQPRQIVGPTTAENSLQFR